VGPGKNDVRLGLMPMVMIGAFRQPSMISGLGKPGADVMPCAQEKVAGLPAGGFDSVGKFWSRSNVE